MASPSLDHEIVHECQLMWVPAAFPLSEGTAACIHVAVQAAGCMHQELIALLRAQQASHWQARMPQQGRCKMRPARHLEC